MTPTFVVLNIYKGQTFNDTLTFQNPDGTPIDLSARTVRMQIREQVESLLPIVELGTADGTIEVNAQGELGFNLDADATALLPSGFEVTQWVYDLEWIMLDETVERPIEGVVVVWPEVTR